jgi:CheY-like chemotaxis protein
MPHVDGFAVLQQLESEARTKAIPVIIATSRSVTTELKSRLPAGVRIFSKESMSRESVSLALKDATGR